MDSATKGLTMKSEGERRIHARLDDLNQRVANIDKHTAEIAAGCKPCKQRLETLDKQINGNGGDGLRAEVIGLSGKLQEMHEDRKHALEQQDRNNKWLRAQLAAVLATLLGVLGMAAKYFLA